MKARNQALWGLWGQIGGCQNILAKFSYTKRERGSVSHRGNFSRERLPIPDRFVSLVTNLHDKNNVCIW